jgi:hypothetical protein
MEAPCALLGWASSEIDFVALASKYDIYVHASDYALNLAVLTQFEFDNAQLPFQQKQMSAVPTQPQTHTVCFLMTDGDNLQWLLNDFTINPSWWASPSRGKLPLGWTLSPALSELAPTVMQMLYRGAVNESATQSDYFVAAPSGVGYAYVRVVVVVVVVVVPHKH